MEELYKLPKDMLVKLIFTIQEETEKKCKEKYEKIIVKDNYERLFMIKCEECDCFILFKNGEVYYSSTDYKIEDFRHCDYCGCKTYCKTHLHLLDFKGKFCYCNECTNILFPISL
jgi:hypothetical protein